MAVRRSSRRSRPGHRYGDATARDRARLALGIKRNLQAMDPEHALAIVMAIAVDMAGDLDGTTRAWFLDFAAKMWDADAEKRAGRKPRR